jgi:hypothetical protein
VSYQVNRNSEGWVIDNCPVNKGVKIGSFDCTANCPNNQNTPKEMEKYGFDIPFIKCSKANELPKLESQLTIEI